MKKHLLLLGAVGAVFIAFAFTNAENHEQTKKIGNKITICHYPPGNPGNVQEITISRNAWCAHKTHHSDFIKQNCEPCPCLTED